MLRAAPPVTAPGRPKARTLAADPDPATSLRFKVEIDGVDIGSFAACEGLGAEYEVFEYQEGGQNGYVHRIPGRLKYTTIKLTRPVDGGSSPSSGIQSLAAWFSSLRTKVTRKNGSITALDARGNEIARWDLVDVYPLRWTGPSFSIEGGSVPKETLELAHNGFLE